MRARTLFLPQVAREVDRMIRLVEDLLELARSEPAACPCAANFRPHRPVAASVVNTFAAIASCRHQLDRAQKCRDAAASTHASALNLVDNALRHAAGRRSTVEVPWSEGGHAGRFVVSDTGSLRSLRRTCSRLTPRRR